MRHLKKRNQSIQRTSSCSSVLGAAMKSAGLVMSFNTRGRLSWYGSTTRSRTGMWPFVLRDDSLMRAFTLPMMDLQHFPSMMSSILVRSTFCSLHSKSSSPYTSSSSLGHLGFVILCGIRALGTGYCTGPFAATLSSPSQRPLRHDMKATFDWSLHNQA